MSSNILTWVKKVEVTIPGKLLILRTNNKAAWQ